MVERRNPARPTCRHTGLVSCTRGLAMNLRSLFGAVAVLLVPLSAQSGTVWKCKEGDRVIFSDAPCPSTGTPMQPGKLQGNVVRAQPVPPKPHPGSESAATGGIGTFSASSRGTSQPAGSVCPSEQDIKNMEVSANSATRSKKDKEFRQEEIRRARQCRAGQGNYTAEDWRISQQAQDDQSSVLDRKRKEAKARAEGMHSAADPAEGDRIHLERITEQKRREERARAAAANASVGPAIVARCTSKGCLDTKGQWYPSAGSSGQIVGPKGLCTVRGVHLHCP